MSRPIPITSPARALSFALACSLASLPTGASPEPAPSAAPAASALEARFLAVPSAEGALATSRIIDSVAHFAGTPGDLRIATAMRDALRSAGFSAELQAYTGRIDTPRRLDLALLAGDGGAAQHFDLHEGPVAGDPDGSRSDAGLPFNYGSGDGDVTAPLVYAGRGRESDYAALAAAGVEVRGAIAIVRYGAQFRGILAERAQAHGAAGVIFYSDPSDDGFAEGSVFPKGPYRPENAVQRGMVADEPLKIPTLPVTAKTAATLLAAFDANATPLPAGWKGALPVSYALGRTKRNAHLVVELDRRIGTMWNTVGVLRGASAQTVVLGGHRDAWVYGVTDNGAGISTLVEIARGFGALAKSGWVPPRTIVIAGWDAEEIGELGSQAYVKTHLDDLRANCIAYLNADENVTGTTFESDAVAAIAGVVQGAARDLDVASVKPPSAPGGGSDHTTFLHGPGIPTAQVAFDGELGTYHSAFDDLRFALTIDPGFALHRKAAQVLGLIALRLVDGAGLPYRFTPYADALDAARASLAARANDAEKQRLASLDASLGAFRSAAQTYDAAPSGRGDAAIIGATRVLDPLIYGAIGYTSSALPAVADALTAHDDAALARAIDATSAALASAARDLATP